MPRADGRIEPGQKLTSAISARAWNRAQQAADIVLGQRLQFTPGQPDSQAGRLVVPCSVTMSVSGVNVAPGFVVKIDNVGAKTIPNRNDSEDNRVATVSSLSGSVITSVSLDHYADAKVQLGVIVGGVRMPAPNAPQIVYVCIAGMCVARVRQRGDLNISKFLQGPVTRSGDEADNLAGAAEACSCGHQRIIQYLGQATDHLQYAVVLL